MAHLTRIRQVMGVIIDDSGGKTIQNRLMAPTALGGLVKALSTQEIRGQIVAKMQISPAPRKSGTLGQPGGKAAGGDPTIGPPSDATITGRKIGLGGMILIGVAILTVIVLLGGRKR